MPAHDAIRDEVLRLAARDLGRYDFAREAARVLRRAVPFDAIAGVWFDPETGLPVDEWSDDSLAIRAHHDTDIAAFRALAASGRRAVGMGRELRSVYFGDSGVWCGFVMYRDQDDVEMANPAAAAWLDELHARRRRLPVVVSAVAKRAREIASGETDLAATARARTASGRWITVRGSVLQNGSTSRTAITLEPVRGAELGELLAEAYGLTARERHVSELVAQGLPNAAIAARLYLSVYTVQDHLKAIFEKLGISNRGQLVARLFLDPQLSPAGPTTHG